MIALSIESNSVRYFSSLSRRAASARKRSASSELEPSASSTSSASRAFSSTLPLFIGGAFRYRSFFHAVPSGRHTACSLLYGPSRDFHHTPVLAQKKDKILSTSHWPTVRCHLFTSGR